MSPCTHRARASQIGWHVWLAAITLSTLLAAPPARAESVAEEIGRVLSLPEPAGPHRVWISDVMLRRTALFDADTGGFLGMLSGGLGTIAPLFARDGREIYLVETHYARGTRGERTDLVTVYDAVSLQPLAEVVIPPDRAEHTSGVASAALSDDGRLLAVFNLTPATSLSIVDVRERRFAGQVLTPGCALVYAAGPRRFASVCGDGSLLSVTLDETGQEIDRHLSEPFFDPRIDPVTEKAVRVGNAWLFVSFEGNVHAVDVSGEEPRFGEVWSLVNDADRGDSWRIGGPQHLAVHEASRRLFALMHQGGIDTHKEPGREVWVYDLDTRERLQRIAVPNAAVGFLRQTLEIDPQGFLGGIADWLLRRLIPNPGVERIQVTQDARPLLFTSTTFPATLTALDAGTGEVLREFEEVGVAGGFLQVP